MNHKLANALTGYAGSPPGVKPPGTAMPSAPRPAPAAATPPPPPPPGAAMATAGRVTPAPGAGTALGKAAKLKKFLEQDVLDMPSSKPVPPPPPPKAFKPKKPGEASRFRQGATSGTL